MDRSTTPLLDAALQYAGRGWRVFPLHSVWFRSAGEPVCTCRRGAECPNAGKHPRTANGFKDATTDPKQIEAWWDKWPQANIGIATGNGLTVMDIDGEAGRKELIDLVSNDPAPFPITLAARTGNGGHLYFSCEGPGSAAKGHLHVRGEGGYVVAPPSIHRSGRYYEWIDSRVGAAVPPDWLRSWLLAGGDGARASQQRPMGGVEAGIAGTALALGPVPAYLQKGSASRLVDKAAIGVPCTLHEQARLWSALKAIPPSIDGKTWVSIGRALHDLDWTEAPGEDLGLDMWDEWSKGSQGRGDGLGLYRGREDLEKRWASFERAPGGGRTFTIASVFHLAAEHGWDGKVEAPHGTNGHKVEEINGFNFAGATSAGGGPIFVDTYKNGDPKPTCANSRIAIRALGITCKHDQFHDKLEVGGQILGRWAGELTDNAIHMLRVAIDSAYQFDPGTVPAHDAAVQECLLHAYDPVAEYLDGLEWDRKPRLENWMSTYLGAELSRLNSTIGILGLVAACRRVRMPGAKFDAITVLVGDEGRGKSQAIEILAGESNFSDQPILNIDERAQQEAMQGVWLYEIADLAGMGKADVDKVKAFASRRIDRARPAYARTRIDRPRRCVFFATTNLHTFLKSQTGNRRFWPVQVGHRIRIDELVRDRDQLWAEANALERAGIPLGLPEALWSEAAAIQLERMEIDPWDDILAHIKPGDPHETWAQGFKDAGAWKEYRITTRDLFEIHLKIPADRQHDGNYKRLAYAMRRLGWDGPKKMRIGNGVARGFAKACST